MIKSTGIPFAAMRWLRENNMKPETVSVNDTSVEFYFDKSVIYISVENDVIKSIRYSPKTLY